MSRDVAAGEPGPDLGAHLAPRRWLAGRNGEEEAQPGPGGAAPLDGLEESPACVYGEPERPNHPGGIQILVDHRLVVVHTRLHTLPPGRDGVWASRNL